LRKVETVAAIVGLSRDRAAWPTRGWSAPRCSAAAGGEMVPARTRWTRPASHWELLRW